MGLGDRYRIKANLFFRDNQISTNVDILVDKHSTIGIIEGLPDDTDETISLFLAQAELLNGFSINNRKLYSGDTPIGWRNKIFQEWHLSRKVLNQNIVYSVDVINSAVIKNSIITGEKIIGSSVTSIFFDDCILENCIIIANTVHVRYNCFFHNCTIYADEIFFNHHNFYLSNCFVITDGETITIDKKERAFTVAISQKMSEIKIDGIPSSVLNLLYDGTTIHPYQEFSADSTNSNENDFLAGMLTNIVVNEEKSSLDTTYKNKKMVVEFDDYLANMHAEQCIITGRVRIYSDYTKKSFKNCRFFDCSISDTKFSASNFEACDFYSSICTLDGGMKIDRGNFYHSILGVVGGGFKRMKYPSFYLHKSLLEASYSDVIVNRKKPFIQTTNSNIHFVLRDQKHIEKIIEHIKRHPGFCEKGVINISMKKKLLHAGTLYPYYHSIIICT